MTSSRPEPLAALRYRRRRAVADADYAAGFFDQADDGTENLGVSGDCQLWLEGATRLGKSSTRWPGYDTGHAAEGRRPSRRAARTSAGSS